jgi:glycosyltransferase involved in cell wall biosynthesis
MAAALRRARVPFLVVVHDADIHPGDGFPLQMRLQRQLVQRADGVVVLTGHVGEQLRAQGLPATKPLILAALPPFAFGPPPPLPLAHGGPLRLLSFGRLLPYKGLDLLAAALAHLGPCPELEVRVVGSGPDSAALDLLRALPGVRVENRWVPEDEVGGLLAWSDALVLSHTEASQSGVAAAAIAARRWVVATRVGGITEQLRGEPLARLCDPTPASLVAAVRRLLDDPPAPVAASDPRTAWQGTAASLVERIGAALGIGDPSP